MSGFLSVGNNKNVSANYAGNENISIYHGSTLIYEGGKIKPGTVLFEGNAKGVIKLPNFKGWERIKNGIEIEFEPLSERFVEQYDSQLFSYQLFMESWFGFVDNKLRIPLSEIEKGSFTFDARITKEEMKQMTITEEILKKKIKTIYSGPNTVVANYFIVPIADIQGSNDTKVKLGTLSFIADSISYATYSLDKTAKFFRYKNESDSKHDGTNRYLGSKVSSSNIIKITAY